MRYAGFFKVGFNEGMATRAKSLILLAVKPTFLVISLFLWRFVYNNASSIGSFSLEDTLNYMFFSIVFSSFCITDADSNLGKKIFYGNLVADMIRPADYIKQEFFYELGKKSYLLVFESIPLLAVALLLGFRAPDMVLFLVSLLSLLLGYALNFMLGSLWGLMYFKFDVFFSLSSLRRALFLLLMGSVVPINFFPSQIQKLSWLMPFQFILYIPSRISAGTFSLAESCFLIAAQIIWIAAIYVLYCFAWDYFSRRFEGVGA